MEGEATTTLRPGDVVGERYRVLAPLGSGGMGKVYKVEHTLMAKEMAMKLLRRELSAIPEVLERFEREARSASRLDNEHIVRVTDFGRAQDGALFLVMELLSGPSLAERLRQGPLGVDEALAVADQLLLALEHAHAQGVVHRDLKPDNVMLQAKEGRLHAKILDFGLAKLDLPGLAEPTLTQAGMVFGTPRYMSPEQAAGEPVDHRTDLYAVGVMLYEMLAGRPIFPGTTAVELIGAHLSQRPEGLALSLPEPGRAERLERTVARALEKHKGERYQSARDFRLDLAACRRMDSVPWGERAPAPALLTGYADTRLRPPEARAPLPRAGSVFAGRSWPRWWPLAAAAALAAGLGLLALSAEEDEGSLLDRAEEALARGDLPAARAIVGQVVAKRADEPRAELVLGHIAYAEDDLPGAVTAYKRALELLPEQGRDPTFQINTRRMLEKDSKVAGPLVTAFALGADAGATDFLVELAQHAPSPRLRSHAYQGLERLKEAGRLDPPAYLAGELEAVASQTCKTRLWYVERLVAFDDPRVLGTLKRERARRTGVLGLSDDNGCMRKLLSEQIEAREKR